MWRASPDSALSNGGGMRFVTLGLVGSIAALMAVALRALRLVLGTPVSPLISGASNMTAIVLAFVLVRSLGLRLRAPSSRWRE